MISANILFLDIFSYTGYKYLILCINYISRLLFQFITLHILITIITSIMLSYFILKTLAAVVPIGSTITGPPRHLILLGIAFMQFVIIIILSIL